MKILIFIFILLPFFLNATLINVPADQPTIQAGIDAATNTDTVLVQPGTYVENINYNGKLITVASLFYTTADTSYISSTIIDGDSIDSVVIFQNGEDSTAVLSGFTITNGFSFMGAGILCDYNSSPNLMNLRISANNSNGYGGGIFFGGSDTNLKNVTISANTAIIGGGICSIGSSPSLENVIISANNNSGIYCENSSPSLKNVFITNNSGGTGGGMYCHTSIPSLINVTISDNTAVNGGGFYCWDSDPILKHVVISNNNATNQGGGIFIRNNSYPILQNVTVSYNTAIEGSGLYTDESWIVITNSIFWNNSPEEFYFGNSIVDVTYSDFDPGWVATGNIDSDPLFVNPDIGDYHLQSNSPCIDTGDPSSPLDPDGSISDMGAYFFPQFITANFSADDANGYSPLLVNFTDLSTPGLGVIDEWFWDFGDGNNSSLQNPSHEYLLTEIYTVSLTVTDNIDSTNTETRINYVTVFGNDPPAPPTDVQVEIEYPDAVITWTAVDTTIIGEPIIPDGYVVQYSENEEDYFYLWFTTETSFIHEFVAQHSSQMFYRVVAFMDLSREEIQYLKGLNDSYHKIRWLDVKQNLRKRSSLK